MVPLFRSADDDNIDYFIPSLGGREVYRFDSTGKHLETYFAKTGQLKYRMNYAGDALVSIQDSYGLMTQFERDGNGNLTSIVGPYGETTHIALNSDGYISSITNPNNESHQIGYSDAGGLLTSFKRPKGNGTTFEYNEIGFLLKEYTDKGLLYQLTKSFPNVSDSSIYSVEFETGEGRKTIYERTTINESSGVSNRISPDGSASSVVNDVNGYEITNRDKMVKSVKKAVDPRLGIAAGYESYKEIALENGLKNIETRSRSVQVSNDSDIFSLISENDLIGINGKEFSKKYDAASRTLSYITPENRSYSYVLNEREQAVQINRPGTASVSLVYDTLGRLKSVTQGDRSISTTYNSNGRVQEIENALGQKRLFEYDNAGRVVKETLKDGRIINYSYDANGNIESLMPPGRQSHDFVFDSVDLVSNYIPPLLSSTQATPTRMSYNLDKQLIKVERPDGRVIHYNYESETERLDSISSAEGNYQYSYIQGNRVKDLDSPYGQKLSFGWNSSVLTSVQYSGEVVGLVSFSFNSDFQIDEVFINGNSAFSYGYDKDMLLTNSGEEVLTRDTFSGFITDVQLDGYSQNYSYSSYGELNGMSSGSLSYSLERDALGRVISKTESNASGSIVWNYSYDLAGRLKTLSKDGVLLETYGYDSNSNRVSVNNQVLGVFDEQDRLLSWGGKNFVYNLNGDLELKTNAQTGDSTSYQYDSFGNLINVNLPTGEAIEYVIDGQDRRVAKKVNGTKVRSYLYLDQLNPVAELNPDNSVKSIFVYSMYSHVPSYMMSGGIKYKFISDHLGSVRFVVNTNTGAVTQELEYDVWGKVTKDTNPGFQPFGFAGGIYDHQTGLVRFGARDYDAETGRWTSKDPILFAGGDTNLYGYVLNDPVNFVDPNGLKINLGSGVTISPAVRNSSVYRTLDAMSNHVNVNIGHFPRHVMGQSEPGEKGSVNITISPENIKFNGYTLDEILIHELLHAQLQLEDPKNWQSKIDNQHANMDDLVREQLECSQ